MPHWANRSEQYVFTFTLQIQFVFQWGGFHRCMISNLLRQVKHLLPFPTLGALPHFSLLPLVGEYFPQLSVNEYNAERLQHIISRWSKTIQTRLLQRKWHVGLILRQWWWLLVSSGEGNGGKENKESLKTQQILMWKTATWLTVAGKVQRYK